MKRSGSFMGRLMDRMMHDPCNILSGRSGLVTPVVPPLPALRVPDGPESSARRVVVKASDVEAEVGPNAGGSGSSHFRTAGRRMIVCRHVESVSQLSSRVLVLLSTRKKWVSCMSDIAKEFVVCWWRRQTNRCTQRRETSAQQRAA